MREVRLEGESFAPGKIVCVGKNFPDHVREMAAAAVRGPGSGAERAVPPVEPVIFIKPGSAVVSSPAHLFIPEDLGLLHHEVELCALVGRALCRASEDEARDAAAGWAVGIDFTLRERQAAAKRAGEPWALSKGFDGAAVLGGFLKPEGAFDPCSVELTLYVGEELRQKGNTRGMTFSPQFIMSFVSRFMTIEPGDIVMCGTPAGVGPARHGDRIRAGAGNLPVLDFTLTRERRAS